MSDAVRDYFKQWLSPGIVLGVIGWVFLLGVASVRLSSLESQVGDLKAAVEASDKAARNGVIDELKANNAAVVELVKYQERIAALQSRFDVLEDKMATQESINVRVFSGLAKLGG